MAAIKCDICGGGLTMDSSGEYALCDSCGMKHTKDRVQAMAQEITGTVAVSNIASIESMMKRGLLALEDANWEQADEYFGKVLDIDAEYAPAYIGKLCAEVNVENETDLIKRPTLTRWANYNKALRFALDEYLAKIQQYDRYSEVYKRHVRKRLKKIHKQIAESEGFSIAKSPNAFVGLGGMVKVSGIDLSDWEVKNVSKWESVVEVANGVAHVVALNSDGTVSTVGGHKETETISGSPMYTSQGTFAGISHSYTKNLYDYWGGGPGDVFNWKGIVAIAAGNYHTVGLQSDGTVVACGRNEKKQCETGSWRDIVIVTAGDEYTIGLRADGTVVATGDYIRGINWWNDISMIYSSKECVVGIKSDDTIVIASKDLNDLHGPEEQITTLLHEKQQKRTEELYNRLVQEKNNASSEDQFYNIARQLQGMNYKDSLELANQCDNQYQVLKKQREQQERIKKQNIAEAKRLEQEQRKRQNEMEMQQERAIYKSKVRKRIIWRMLSLILASIGIITMLRIFYLIGDAVLYVTGARMPDGEYTFFGVAFALAPAGLCIAINAIPRYKTRPRVRVMIIGFVLALIQILIASNYYLSEIKYLPELGYFRLPSYSSTLFCIGSLLLPVSYILAFTIPKEPVKPYHMR